MKTVFTLFHSGIYTCRISKFFLCLLAILFSIALIAQSIGDFRSQASGDWNNPNTWEVYTGNNWVDADSFPGSNASPNAKVLIKACDTVTNTTEAAYSINTLTVAGILRLSASLSLPTTNELIVEGGSINWTSNHTNLNLPQNAGLMILGPKNICSPENPHVLGLSAEPCNNTQAMYIGSVKYTACKGHGNSNGGNFEDVNNSEGSLMAAPGADINAICSGSTQQPQLFGNAVQYGTTLGELSYTWSFVSGPDTISLPNTRNITLPVFTEDGDYVFNLKVTPSKNPLLANTRPITISVGGSTEFIDSVEGPYWTHDIPSTINHRKAKISADYNTGISGSFDACSCEVTNGKTLTIAADTHIRVLREINNQGVVILENDGNLLQTEDTAVVNVGNIEFRKIFNFDDSDSNNLRRQYNFVISPVEGQNLKGIFPNNANPTVIEYRESNNFFYNHNGSYTKGKGLAVREPSQTAAPGSSVTASFTGIPANGIINYPLNYSGPGLGYNLTGNPYPSSIDIEAFYADNSSLIESTFYFWDNRGNTQYTQQGSSYSGVNYAIYNVLSQTGNPKGKPAEQASGPERRPTQFVKSGTAFIVQAKSAGLIQFKNAYRSADNSGPAFFGKNANLKDRYWLRLQTPGGLEFSNAVVYFENGSNEFGLEDSKAMGGSDEIFTLAGPHQLAINGRSTFDVSDIISLGVRHYHSGTYSIGIKTAEGIFENMQEVYLKDKYLNTLQNLSESDYEYESVAGEFTDRFEILYQYEAIEDDQANGNLISIARQGNFFVVQSNPNTLKEVEIFNLSGVSVYKIKNINSHTHKIQSNSLEKSVLFVHILTETGERIIKNIINN